MPKISVDSVQTNHPLSNSTSCSKLMQDLCQSLVSTPDDLIYTLTSVSFKLIITM